MWQTLIDMHGEAARILTASLYAYRPMTVDGRDDRSVDGRDEHLQLTVVVAVCHGGGGASVVEAESRVGQARPARRRTYVALGRP